MTRRWFYPVRRLSRDLRREQKERTYGKLVKSGSVHAAEGKFDEALAELERAIFHIPARCDAFVARASL
jgi:hypothetical protein